ncbi:hypothetical protein C5O27_02670 [Gordonia alkanivorans]|uniref:dynamin family protein n=1 Tax=Gordonia alkanivorans TaxID=84096 RepID=UPI000FDF3A51|nr:dynamin family protein [Gordonia alkanivorans]AZZ80132.1 hypothetical protein C5O27_02670 [Gordonia alkanivorans]
MTRPATAEQKKRVDPVVAAGAILKRFGKDREAEQIAEVASRIPPSRTVVVVGEVKRGKSSLVNALIGVPGLAKVDTDIATSAEVRYVPTSADRVRGSASLLLPGGRRHEVPLGEVVEWVTIDGKAADAEATVREIDAMVPIGAEVVVDAAHLPRTTIVDTPGVNGFDPRHMEAAVTATNGACALVMVCDALAPINSAELEFLQSVTAEIGTVILAVTKTDKALTSWRSIVDDNRRLLAENAPQFAGIPIVGVSNLFALKAMRSQDDARTPSLWKSSGIPELASAIDDALGDPLMVVRRNALQCAMVALAGLQAELETSRQAIVDAPRVHREMTEEKARLEELQAAQKEWSTRLGQRLTRLQLASDNRGKVLVGDFKQRWEKRFDKLGVVGLSRHSQRIVGEMSIEVEALCNQIVTELRSELNDLAIDMMGEAFLKSESIAEALSGLEAVDLRPPREYERWKGFLDPQLVSMAMAGGGLSALAGPFAVALIPVWGVVIVGFRATKFGKQNLTRWLNDTLRQAQEDTSSAIRTVLNEFGPELRLTYAETLAESLAESRRLLKESAEQARADEAKRSQSLGVLDTELNRASNILKALAADRALTGTALTQRARAQNS